MAGKKEKVNRPIEDHGRNEIIMSRRASGADALLVWAQSVGKDYGVEVNNFTTSWKDGMVFAAIVDHYHKGGIDFASLSPDNPMENLERAFTAAEEDGIPRLLEPEDFQIQIPDRLSTMTYLSRCV